eukprot:scaffold1206_cov105-Skeletonema_menzelii.AAC.5
MEGPYDKKLSLSGPKNATLQKMSESLTSSDSHNAANQLHVCETVLVLKFAPDSKDSWKRYCRT